MNTVRLWKYLIVFALGITPLLAQAQNDVILPSADIQNREGTTEIQVGKNTYRVQAMPNNMLWQDMYNSLPAEKQNDFHKNRNSILKSIAQILSTGKIILGVGSLTIEKTKNAANRVVDYARMRVIKDFYNPYEIFIEDDPRQEEKERSLRIRGHDIVESILEGVNQRLWSQSPLISNVNEFGGNIEIDLSALGGAKEKGWGGYLGLGLSFGFNKESKTFVFQFYGNREKFKSSAAAAMMIGISGKAGIYFADNNALEGAKARVSNVFYPPAVPGFSGHNSNSMVSGFSTGLGWPPPPLADILTYNTTAHHLPLIRIIVSPNLKGFIRIQTGLNFRSMHMVIAPLSSFIDHVRTIFGARLCKKLYIN